MMNFPTSYHTRKEIPKAVLIDLLNIKSVDMNRDDTTGIVGFTQFECTSVVATGIDLLLIWRKTLITVGISYAGT